MPVDETVRRTIEQTLRDWVTSLPNPNDPIIDSAGTGEALSPNDILEQVTSRSEEGNQFVERWHQMAYEKALKDIMNASLDSGDEELEVGSGF